MASEQEQARDSVNARWVATFEDRYGVGSYQRLIELLRQPCVTFAEIAKPLGVTRERVRQWQLLLLPDAPRGHERQRLCGLLNQKRRLLQDSLFRSFYRHARPHFDAGRIGLVKAGEGYRTRSVRIDGRTLALRNASRAMGADSLPSLAQALVRYSGSADFVYLRLAAPDDYLVLPASELRSKPRPFLNLPPRYQPFKNTFAALDEGRGENPVRTTDSAAASARR